jgi:ferric-dicitrate binding protein FerR (iron transport regulator)
MNEKFVSPEELVSDERFIEWYFKSGSSKALEMEKWIESNPHQAGLLSESVELMEIFNLPEKEIPKIQIDRAEQRLFDMIAPGELEDDKVVPILRRRRHWGWAAAIILLIASGSVWLLLNRKNKNIDFKTDYGQIVEQHLPDGSTVTLNANSTLTLSSGWDQIKDREVWLKGEAFFKVAKTVANSRFIVHTNKFDIIVTGTQFNVSNQDDKTSVMLTEGSVTVKTIDGKEVYMKAGDFVEFTNTSNQVEEKSAKEETILAWKDKKLIFDNTSLGEVAKIINGYYGVIVNIEDDELNNKTITGIWPNDDLDALLQAMEATQDFKVIRNKDTITFKKP